MADDTKTSAEDAKLYHLFNEIGIIDQLSGAAFRTVLPPPLNQAMFGVLNHFVRLSDGKTPGELASAFQVARPSMTATIGKLDRAGYVTVDPDDEDGRSKRVYITSEGREAREAAVAAAQSLFARIMPQLTQLDIDALIPQLTALREVLDADRN